VEGLKLNLGYQPKNSKNLLSYFPKLNVTDAVKRLSPDISLSEENDYVSESKNKSRPWALSSPLMG